MSEFYVYTDRDQPESRYVFTEPSPDLEARPNFTRVDNLDGVPQATIDALRRAKAERASVEAASATRTRRVELDADEVVAAHQAGNVSLDGPGAVLATAAHYQGQPSTPPTGVLSRPGVDAVQIGPNPEQHPRTREELQAKADADALEAGNTGVLSRQSLSTKNGGGQIGDRPGQHPRNRAELLAAADAGSDGSPITASGKALAGQDVDPDDESASDVEHVDDDAEQGDGGADDATSSTGPVVEPPQTSPAKKAAPKKATPAAAKS